MTVIQKSELMKLWKLDELPYCLVGIELATVFVQKSINAVTDLDSIEAVMPLRNSMIRAHRDLVDHRSTCPNCHESDGVEKAEAEVSERRKILYMPDERL